jgi:hypothetical protein
MPKRIPSKMPTVEGEGAIAEGFRLSFDKINEILEYLESVQPAPSADSLTDQTVTGVTRRPKKRIVAGEGEDDGAARWA